MGSSLRWRRLEEEHGLEHALEREWAANSYADDCLDVYGVRHPLMYDTRLRDLVAPWVEDQTTAGTGAATRIVSFQPRSSTDLEDVGGAMTGPVLGQMQVNGEGLNVAEVELLMATAALALAGREPCSVLVVGDSVDRLASVLGQAVPAICPEADVHVMPDANPDEGGGTVREYIPVVSTDRPTGLVMVDGPRDYAAISRAVADVDPLLIAGGYVAFGEYDSPAYPAVTDFVNELFDSGRYQKVRCAGSIAVARKLPLANSPDDTNRLDSRRPTPPDPASRVLVATADALRETLERAGWIERRSELVDRYHLELIRALRGTLDERTAWAERMVAEAEQRGAVIAELQAALVERTAWAERMVAEAEQRGAVIAELQQALAERRA